MHRLIKAAKSYGLLSAAVFAAAFLLLPETEALGAYLEREYNDMDADADGYVNLNEFRFYETSGIRTFSEIDRNSNGRIEFREWTTFRDKGYPFASRYRLKDRGYAPRFKSFPGYRYKPGYRYRPGYRYPYDRHPRFGLGLRFGFNDRRHGFLFGYRDRYHPRYGYDWHPQRNRFW
ncbi:MAG: hypothetical protein C4530_12710 [Desulfobacteraceae bacterium]|nr:MAG: hypothetical protein C4530_12710 [Desulfobacteraceae bacterium]